MSLLRRLKVSLPFAPLLLLLLAAATLPAAAQLTDEKPKIDLNFDQPPSPSDPLTHILLFGQDGSWSGKVDSGHYILENSADDSSVRYFQFGLSNAGKDRDLGNATESVDVSGDFQGGTAGAGLLYRFDPANNHYFGFVLTNTGFAILQRDDSGLHGATQELTPHPTGSVTLSIRPNNGKAEFLINGDVIGAITAPAGSASRVGLIALGHGKFAFDNFKVSVPPAG